MLDVHPPHQPVNGWRDFLLHIATITIGLFIALMLEAGVEWLHHRHIVHEARENIRHEIEQNHTLAAEDLRYLQEDIDRMHNNLVTIHALAAKPKDFHGRLQFTMSWSSFSDAAWRSSRDMGALAYMPYSEVQGYSDVYGQQDLVRQQAIDIFTRQVLSATPVFMESDLSQLAPDEVRSLLHDTAASSLSLTTLKQIVQQLDDQYVATLKQQP